MLTLTTGVILLLVVVVVLAVVVFFTRRKNRFHQNPDDISMIPYYNPDSVGQGNSGQTEDGFILLREWIKLEEEIGQGCFGQVYRGRYHRPGSPSTSETVAVKILKPTGGGQREAERELIREARTMTKFSHPNILGAIGIVINGDILMVIFDIVEYENISNAFDCFRRGSWSHLAGFRVHVHG